MKKIGIIGAMEVEVNFLRNLMGDEIKKTEAGSLVFNEGKIHGVDVVLVRSGVGKVNAALCAQRLALQFGCTNIINTGIAGAMAHGLGVMDFVVSTDAVYHDLNATGFGYKLGQVPQMPVFSFEADKGMIEVAKKAFAESEFSKEHKMIEGRIATGDQFISDKEHKAFIAKEFSPACVEMEGAAIAHACYLNTVPFVILRCMSDMADDSGSKVYDFNESTAAEMSARVVEKLICLI
ncbi:MAG: 5'-methylthioadenosine/adenosylhomocysteine nucleosidase [Treponema sp.]|uniref:5'-methylthioadenosine/adenosylhomocysteine nucleosidase n=1 Tax=Treponema sp. TaxID=166 RepID=UPI0025EC1C85|nr:5'-methylthioadenosine/adenosylhomocysteine nucleosidase [Treponema sp.]MBR0496885.1 5'-methylthioadenosine/adenosylhomocysteine nucleosidase [Treponema sp.]